MLTTVIIVFFLLFAVVVTSIMAGMRFLEKSRKKQVAAMLQTVDGELDNLPAVLLKAKPEDKNAFDTAMAKFDVSRKVRLLMTQADMTWTLQNFAMYSLIAALIGGFLGTR